MSFRLDQPAQKKIKLSSFHRKKNMVDNPESTYNTFLDFLQKQRNFVLQENKKIVQIKNNLQSYRQKIKSEDLDRQTIIELKRKILSLEKSLTEMEIKVTDLHKFDEELKIMLQLYHNSGQDNNHVNQQVFIDMYKQKFLLTETIPNIVSVENLDTCQNCNTEYLRLIEDSALLCSSCGETKLYMDASISTIAYGDEIEYTSFSYKRINHLNEWLNHFQAKEASPVKDSVIEKIMKYLYEKRYTNPKTITFSVIKKAQKVLGLRKYYDQTMQIWCRITGNKPVRLDPICEEKIRLMFIRIQEPFEKHCPKNRKNFLSYPYVIYKFCQMLGYDHLLSYFTLLKGKEKLKLQESIFKKICAEIGWTFIETKNIC
jgi:hypothetical protein